LNALSAFHQAGSSQALKLQGHSMLLKVANCNLYTCLKHRLCGRALRWAFQDVPSLDVAFFSFWGKEV
ncbi:hypothetical protein, partial [Pseudomonas syringae]|uniref:hypothetical protein n=1 Tax=Pseudomonas syringae TaxID=317 RepID=UPI0034D509B0